MKMNPLNQIVVQAEMDYRRERARGYRTDGEVARANRRQLRRRNRHHRVSSASPFDQ